MQSRSFVGCMRNLSIDGRNVDMASFIANNGTKAGTSWGCGSRTEEGRLPVRGSDCSWNQARVHPA